MAEALDLKLARDLGVFQEINRRLLHPVGLALAYEQDNRTGAITGMFIRDDRRDAQGHVFGNEEITSDKMRRQADSFARMEKQHEKARKLAFGFVVQPIGEDGQVT